MNWLGMASLHKWLHPVFFKLNIFGIKGQKQKPMIFLGELEHQPVFHAMSLIILGYIDRVSFCIVMVPVGDRKELFGRTYRMIGFPTSKWATK